jgi:hypothetical protein
MFGQIYESNNKKFCLYVTIKCEGKKKLRVFAEDYGKKNSRYVDRQVVVDSEKTIRLSFPVTPKKLFLGILNADNVYAKDFTIVSIIEGELQEYNIWIDSATNDFLKLAVYFSQICGFTDADPRGRLFKTSDGSYNIVYYDAIRDIMSGTIITTPSRIGHTTGRIDVAKCKFDNYTFPMRMTILAHEYSHKYRNPKIGLEISNETGADINAIYMMLGMGFSKVDIICVFAKVFLVAQTDKNIIRMRKIIDYIDRFEKEEFAELK